MSNLQISISNLNVTIEHENEAAQLRSRVGLTAKQIELSRADDSSLLPASNSSSAAPASWLSWLPMSTAVAGVHRRVRIEELNIYCEAFSAGESHSSSSATASEVESASPPSPGAAEAAMVGSFGAIAWSSEHAVLTCPSVLALISSSLPGFDAGYMRVKCELAELTARSADGNILFLSELSICFVASKNRNMNHLCVSCFLSKVSRCGCSFCCCCCVCCWFSCS
jgi:hypothetical protein